MSKVAHIPFRYHLAHYIARKGLQSIWQRLNALSYWGLGYNNWISRLNGEDAFARDWAEQHASRQSIIFDVGANEGDFTGNLLRLVPGGEFHLFEPNPQTFSRLTLAYSKFTNVHLNPCGMGNSSGSASLYDFRDGRGSERASFLPETFSVILKANPANIRGSEVPIVTLDQYCTERSIEKIDLLKIDTEGFEKFVLEGGRHCFETGAVDTIQLELNEQNAISGFNLFQLQEMLPNYDIFRLLPDGMTPVLVGPNAYDARFDIPRYCNIVLFRRGSAIPIPG